MEDLAGVLVVLGLAVLAVPVLLIAALVSIGGLKRRVGSLEHELALLRAAPVSAAFAGRTESPSPSPESTAPPPRPSPMQAVAEGSARSTGATAHASSATAAVPPPLPAASAARINRPARPLPFAGTAAPSRPQHAATAVAALQRWFTEGNVPVKVGMLVLLAGVAALLKYASDQG